MHSPLSRRRSVDPKLPRLDRATRGDARDADGIHRGDRGRSVENLQRHLRAAGHDPGPVDGWFGPRTQEAVRSFRAKHGLGAGGRVNAETWARLDPALFPARGPTTPPQQVGEIGRSVRHSELQLARLGFDTGRIDGVFTHRTRRAVQAFQGQQQLASTGEIDARTRARLDREVERRDPLAGFDRTPPRAGYGRVRYGGQLVNARTRELMRRAERIMDTRYGHRGFRFELTQGSYNPGGVGASAGTHDGGGAIDVRTLGRSRREVNHMVRALREAGFAAWSRGRGHDPFAPHIHAIAIGDRELAGSARSQVGDYFAGRNGLANGARDPDAGLGRPIPRWARRFG